MSWFNLKQTMGTNYTADPGDIINTKKALNQIGYYDVPPHRGIDDWTDDAMFNGVRAFQKDKGLKVDGLMRPGGPTETAINANLIDNKNSAPEQKGGNDGGKQAQLEFKEGQLEQQKEQLRQLEAAGALKAPLTK